MSCSSEASDVLVFFMASVPGEMFGVLTKSTHWDTDAVFLQWRSEKIRHQPTATRPTAPPTVV